MFFRRLTAHLETIIILLLNYIFPRKVHLVYLYIVVRIILHFNTLLMSSFRISQTILITLSLWFNVIKWVESYNFIVCLIMYIQDLLLTYTGDKETTWSYGCWIYNYLGNQCISPLKFKSRSWRCVFDIAYL